jgi:hypothetical protein
LALLADLSQYVFAAVPESVDAFDRETGAGMIVILLIRRRPWRSKILSSDVERQQRSIDLACPVKYLPLMPSPSQSLRRWRSEPDPADSLASPAVFLVPAHSGTNFQWERPVWAPECTVVRAL